jgi:hypothetical protein
VGANGRSYHPAASMLWNINSFVTAAGRLLPDTSGPSRRWAGLVPRRPSCSPAGGSMSSRRSSPVSRLRSRGFALIAWRCLPQDEDRSLAQSSAAQSRSLA